VRPLCNSRATLVNDRKWAFLRYMLTRQTATLQLPWQSLRSLRTDFLVLYFERLALVTHTLQYFIATEPRHDSSRLLPTVCVCVCVCVRPAVAERSRDQQYNTSSAIFCYWLLRLQIYHCVQLNSVLFSSASSSMPAVINKIY